MLRRRDQLYFSWQKESDVQFIWWNKWHIRPQNDTGGTILQWDMWTVKYETHFKSKGQVISWRGLDNKILGALRLQNIIWGGGRHILSHIPLYKLLKHTLNSPWARVAYVINCLCNIIGHFIHNNSTVYQNNCEFVCESVHIQRILLDMLVTYCILIFLWYCTNFHKSLSVVGWLVSLYRWIFKKSSIRGFTCNSIREALNMFVLKENFTSCPTWIITNCYLIMYVLVALPFICCLIVIVFYFQTAQDSGGPRKEFFCLLLKEIGKVYFGRVLRSDVAEKYHTVGIIFGMIVLLLNCFSLSC